MLPDEQATPEQLAIFKAMTPEQRWHAARQLYWTVRKHKEAFLRSEHPDWTDAQLKKKSATFSSVPEADLIHQSGINFLGMGALCPPQVEG